MVDVTVIVKLAYALATIPTSVRINKSQCQLLADRVMALAGHLERMEEVQLKQKLEKNHEATLLRAQSILVDCTEFMSSFKDGFWMTKALYREKHKEQFQELHEGITYLFQILHLEIDFMSLSEKTFHAEATDVANMEEQLVLVAGNMEKLERSVTAMTDESKRQHEDVMVALKSVRVYRKTLNQDQMKAVLADAGNELADLDESARAACGSSSPTRVLSSGSNRKAATPTLGFGGSNASAGTPIEQKQDEIVALAGEVPTGSLPAASRSIRTLRADAHVSNIKAVQAAVRQQNLGLGSSLHLKPFSQSYGVGLIPGVMAGGWFDDAISVNEGVVGEGGAKRGEYEVSFGEGQMGMSLKNVEARAEVSKVEAGGAAHAAGVRPGDNVVGINGRIPLGYTQVMGTLPVTPRPVRIRFIRGQRTTTSPEGNLKKSHTSAWASNAVTAGVHHPAGDKGVLLEMYAKASFSPTPWVRSEGWDALPLFSTVGSEQEDNENGNRGDASRVADALDTLSRWSGVRVGRAGKVIEVRLPGNNMNGVLPPSMGSLDELRTVELRENRLEGNIPESLRYLEKLKKVDLAYNLLQGSLPAGDARWINSMSTLQLNNNKLSGHIPSTLGRLTNLTHLDLSFNGLSGTIPPELCSARSLEVLSLAHNGITGPIPSPLRDFSKLKVLNISNNKLTGPLPPGLERLTSLQELRLNHNSLSGSIPDDALNNASLVLVDLSSNGLGGEIPSNLGTHLTNLVELDISRNSLCGEIPSSIGGIRKLKKLNLEKNTIEGPLPTSLAELSALGDLNLSSNLLGGPLLHIQWGNLSSLQHLHLAHNKFGESLPASLGSLGSLVSLTLNANQLTGNIPRELHELTGLKLLDLSGNKIAPTLLSRSSFFRERRTLKKKLSACDVRF